MRRSPAKFSELEASNHTPSLADFITTTPVLKLSVHTGGDRGPGALVMSIIPLDLERRCEQRWAARFSAARALQEQHRLERQQHQQLTAPRQSQKENPPGWAGGLEICPSAWTADRPA